MLTPEVIEVLAVDKENQLYFLYTFLASFLHELFLPGPYYNKGFCYNRKSKAEGPGDNERLL